MCIRDRVLIVGSKGTYSRGKILEVLRVWQYLRRSFCEYSQYLGVLYSECFGVLYSGYCLCFTSSISGFGTTADSERKHKQILPGVGAVKYFLGGSTGSY